MPKIPSKLYQVALLGFSDFERSTLGSCFRLGAATGAAYALTAQTDEADFLLADADHAPSVQLVRATDRATTTVFIGADPPDDALCWMSRPIDPLRVLRELQALAAMSAAPQPDSPADVAAAPETWQPETQPGWEPEWPPGWRPAEAAVSAAPESAPVPRAEPVPVVVKPLLALEPKPLDTAQPAARPTRQSRGPRVARVSPTAPRTALVVDDSEVAARFLRRRLEPWGLQVECAAASRQALELLENRTYDLIFVDVELGPHSELDGLALCQRIKQSAATVGASVIVVSAHQSELDRARGALAGCDAYLGKPLTDAELAPLLLRRGLARVTVQADAS